MRLALTVLLAFAVSATTQAAPGDLWEVRQYSTNIRSGPGTEHRILTQAARADVTMELQRQGNWLELILVDGGQGWVRDDLLDALTPGESEVPTPGFQLFEQMLIAADGAGGMFMDPTYLGYSVVLLTVNDTYLSLPADSREHQLEDLLRLWQTINNTGIPATIILRLEDGRRMVSKSALTGTHRFIEIPPS